MPRKRRLQKRRLDVLCPNMRDHLVTGHYFWGPYPDEDEFEDEDHRREAWELYRAELMAEGCHPGRRPTAFWQYDVPGGWEAHGESEADAVYQLLKSGELEPITRNGANRITSEIETIESQWLHDIQVAVVCRDRPPAYIRVSMTYGCPQWFFNLHMPQIHAEQLAQMEAFRARIARGGANGEVAA